MAILDAHGVTWVGSERWRDRQMDPVAGTSWFVVRGQILEPTK
jgi:hypothetical protein